MGSEAKSAAWSWPVIGRAAAGLCAVANLASLSILGVIIADAVTSSTAAVLEAMAPPKGPLGLLASGYMPRSSSALSSP